MENKAYPHEPIEEIVENIHVYDVQRHLTRTFLENGGYALIQKSQALHR